PRLEAAIRYAPRLAIVAEVKRASPSAGRFEAVGPDPDHVAALARGYAAAGAAGVSILTEPTRFGGSDDDLEASSRSGVPLLRKDFTVDRYGVWQARAIGAGAVLLIARILPGWSLAALVGEAGEAGIDALVEVHDPAELDRALAADATLLGVNARNLGTLAVDLEPTLALISAAREAGATVLAESGLETPDDLRRAAAAGAHGVLIGTALLRAPDPAARLADLVAEAPARSEGIAIPAPPSRTLVKVCGIRDEAMARAAGHADADLAGFVLDPASRRALPVARVAELAPMVGRASPVLVFRSPGPAQVRRAVEASGVRSVQLAGFDAPPAWLATLASGLRTVIGVVHRPLAVRATLQAAEAWFAAGATHVLLEGAAAGAGGGSGSGAPVALARRIGRIVPVGLAGGLTVSNLAAAVLRGRPAFVDASSGLEREGRGDARRVAAFVRAARRDPSGADRVDRRGRFGRFGGRYVPETLVPALEELAHAWSAARRDPAYRSELARLQRDFIGRPTPLFELSAAASDRAGGGPRLFLKREDLAHTGAHKINNAVGQALLARRMGKPRVIAETGAGQHGVATAAACALLGLECVVYMGSTDIDRQASNVRRMELLGAEVRPVNTGNGTLRDALNAALRDWVASVETTYYILGSAAGPDPYPELVAELQSVIGREARRQVLEATGQLPDVAVACVGGGSNAIGLFRPFLDTAVRLVAVEAGGRGDGLGDNAASLGLGRPGVLHGAFSMLTQTEAGQVVEPHSISAGLDYPGVGPQLAALAESGRLEVTRATDDEALDALAWLSRCAGILPALEPAHALAAARRLLPDLAPDAIVLVNLSGRGDKDLDIVARQARMSAEA
ncbi:MAG TPA: tryptophan synthase subunit beta, partial [Candidatus Limnocylindria bacterium]|nr:tryptophan synthase subunit beta [Candidatus Limnocylindria bacterium]